MDLGRVEVQHRVRAVRQLGRLAIGGPGQRDPRRCAAFRWRDIGDQVPGLIARRAGHRRVDAVLHRGAQVVDRASARGGVEHKIELGQGAVGGRLQRHAEGKVEPRVDIDANIGAVAHARQRPNQRRGVVISVIGSTAWQSAQPVKVELEPCRPADRGEEGEFDPQGAAVHRIVVDEDLDVGELGFGQAEGRRDGGRQLVDRFRVEAGQDGQPLCEQVGEFEEIRDRPVDDRKGRVEERRIQGSQRLGKVLEGGRHVAEVRLGDVPELTQRFGRRRIRLGQPVQPVELDRPAAQFGQQRRGQFGQYGQRRARRQRQIEVHVGRDDLLLDMRQRIVQQVVRRHRAVGEIQGDRRGDGCLARHFHGKEAQPPGGGNGAVAGVAERQVRRDQRGRLVGLVEEPAVRAAPFDQIDGTAQCLERVDRVGRSRQRTESERGYGGIVQVRLKPKSADPRPLAGDEGDARVGSGGVTLKDDIDPGDARRVERGLDVGDQRRDARSGLPHPEAQRLDVVAPHDPQAYDIGLGCAADAERAVRQGDRQHRRVDARGPQPDVDRRLEVGAKVGHIGVAGRAAAAEHRKAHAGGRRSVILHGGQHQVTRVIQAGEDAGGIARNRAVAGGQGHCQGKVDAVHKILRRGVAGRLLAQQHHLKGPAFGAIRHGQAKGQVPVQHGRRQGRVGGQDTARRRGRCEAEIRQAICRNEDIRPRHMSKRHERIAGCRQFPVKGHHGVGQVRAADGQLDAVLDNVDEIGPVDFDVADIRRPAEDDAVPVDQAVVRHLDNVARNRRGTEVDVVARLLDRQLQENVAVRRRGDGHLSGQNRKGIGVGRNRRDRDVVAGNTVRARDGEGEIQAVGQHAVDRHRRGARAVHRGRERGHACGGPRERDQRRAIRRGGDRRHDVTVAVGRHALLRQHGERPRGHRPGTGQVVHLDGARVGVHDDGTDKAVRPAQRLHPGATGQVDRAVARGKVRGHRQLEPVRVQDDGIDGSRRGDAGDRAAHGFVIERVAGREPVVGHGDRVRRRVEPAGVEQDIARAQRGVDRRLQRGVEVRRTGGRIRRNHDGEIAGGLEFIARGGQAEHGPVGEPEFGVPDIRGLDHGHGRAVGGEVEAERFGRP